MNYETFKSSAIAFIQKQLGDNAAVILQPIMKNNSVRLDGLIIENHASNISPTLYLNYYYEDYLAGKSLSSVCEDIISSYHANLPQQNMDLSFFTDYQKAKRQIILKLVHYRRNEELLQNVPHFRFLDLAVVFCCFLPDTEQGNASILIYNHHLDLWQASASDLYEIALKNTPLLLPFEICSMEETLKGICPSFYIAEDKAEAAGHPFLYVLTNTAKLYGASAILYPNVLHEFAMQKNCDLYLLPSSIHEILLLPKSSSMDISDLNQIIKEVNLAHVLEEEILSDHAYCFDRESGFAAAVQIP